MSKEKGNYNSTLHCNFCGKSQREVKKLIAGPGVYICDECIELCNEIIFEDSVKSVSKAALDNVPKPHEIKEHLDSYVIGQDRAKKITYYLKSSFYNVDRVNSSDSYYC